MGAYLQITPALRTKLGYGDGARLLLRSRGQRGSRAPWFRPKASDFDCDIDLFDAEKDPFPYADEYFSTVLCCELIEHLLHDPMHLMSEVNRILKPGGHLVLTTPNIASVARDLRPFCRATIPDFFTLTSGPQTTARPTPATIANTRRSKIHKSARKCGVRDRAPRDRPVSRRAQAPEYAWVLHCWSATISIPDCAATASTRWAARPARCASVIPPGSIRDAAPMMARSRTRKPRRTMAVSDHGKFCDPESVVRRRGGPPEGFAVGYHVFDPGTDTLVVDGPRTVPQATSRPGKHAASSFSSSFRRSRAAIAFSFRPCWRAVYWFYERGARVPAGRRGGGGRARQRREIPRDNRSARWAANGCCARSGAPSRCLFETILRNRSLIRTMVRRDVLGRYRGSFGGGFWTVLNPLILMLTYFFVFGVVLRTRFPNDPSRSGFALYFLAGMLPWLAVSEAAGRAPTVMLEHRNFVKKLVFPVETLPLNLVTAGLVSEIFGVALFLAGSYLAHGIRSRLDRLAAGARRPSDSADRGPLLVPGRARSVRARSGPGQRLPADAVVFPDAHLLSRKLRCPGPRCGFLRRIPCSFWPAAIAPRCSKAVRPLSVRTGSCAWFQRRYFLLGHAWFYKLRKSFADII